MARHQTHPITLSGQKARQGEIILRHRWARVVFIAGFVGAFVLAGVLWFLAS